MELGFAGPACLKPTIFMGAWRRLWPLGICHVAAGMINKVQY